MIKVTLTSNSGIVQTHELPDYCSSFRSDCPPFVGTKTSLGAWAFVIPNGGKIEIEVVS